VARAARLHARGLHGRHGDLLHHRLLRRPRLLEPGNDVSWANEALPLLGLGPVVPLWVSLAVADWGVKLALALIALVPFRLIVKQMTRRLRERF
jgi:hypothetical protein